MMQNRNKDIETSEAQPDEVVVTDLWWKDLLPDFKVIPRNQLPPGANSGISGTSLCINTALHLPWLVSQCLANGVVIKRHVLTSLSKASSLHHSGSPAKLVVNCTGISACKLGGLGPDGTGDKLVYPARGQTVLVRNEMEKMIEISGTDEAEDESTYVMTRAAGGGTVLGGCYQKGKWESQPDPNMAMRIMRRAVELYPELGKGKGVAGLDVVRHAVGLRPVREGGTRLAASWVEGVLVVHNYGHGGFGYQCGYGCSMAAVKLVEDVLEDCSNVPQEDMVDFGMARL
jgi:D-amino-acid oxidase